VKKIYYLSTCDTCARIMHDLKLSSAYQKQDIKRDPITEEQLEEMFNLAGSYEALFSKRAKLYKEKGLKERTLTDDDMGSLILGHYTFLKRPVIINNDKIFIGNSKKTIEAAKESLK